MAGLGARSVLVTGANRGIGLELVRQLLGKPDPPQWVFACSREPDGERGQELRNLASRHPNVVMIKLDATSPASVKDAAGCVEDHLKGSGLNLLINNAGIYKEVDLEAVDLEDMINKYKTNVVGPLLVSQAFLPLLRRAAQASLQEGLSCRKAAIVNISSLLGSIKLVSLTYGKPAISYRCSKAALNMLTECQAMSYKEDGILCTMIHPGWVKTDMGGQEADVTVDESVRGILSVLSTLSNEHSGAFFDWKGKKLPW
ncbi:C-factor-like isoform X1 [Hemicordylus capensis]|uniref:C-factor-like isoform X1 n=1 Tax=Hemicordylus capensis TaxID=884348 RepID=UPI0023021BE9|nr:C-factor-like isoform X1 [Hemicordylus capensis]